MKKRFRMRNFRKATRSIGLNLKTDFIINHKKYCLSTVRLPVEIGYKYYGGNYESMIAVYIYCPTYPKGKRYFDDILLCKRYENKFEAIKGHKKLLAKLKKLKNIKEACYL